VKIYLSQDWFLKFLNGDENASEYEGFYNEGESWIFLPLPGYRNASLRMPGKNENGFAGRSLMCNGRRQS
jgi:hypothetical protein